MRMRHGSTGSLGGGADPLFGILSKELSDLGFMASTGPAVQQHYRYMFRELQEDPANRLPTSIETRDALINLGRSMNDTVQSLRGDSGIPSGYTYLGQFIDHDMTHDTLSRRAGGLIDSEMRPKTPEEVERDLKSRRTPSLDLDSIYDPPARRDGERMAIGTVTSLNGKAAPDLRPLGKDEFNDLPRKPKSKDEEEDRAACIGDPRNDENLVLSQLHLAFLLAHNTLVSRGKSFEEARTLLRRHYQYMVIHDYLGKVADSRIINSILTNGTRFYKPADNEFSIPVEFTAAAFRFGHTMIRSEYNYNVNFNRSMEAVTATLDMLFTFTAFSGPLGIGEGTDTLPENWIIQWENFVDVIPSYNRARRIDPCLVEPLSELPQFGGVVEVGDGRCLGVRNLLRGYLYGLPTGQAVARALGDGFPVLDPVQLKDAAVSVEQIKALTDGDFLERTPLWYYILAEAAVFGEAQRLGPVGSTIVGEVIIKLVERSTDSILKEKNWQPTLGQNGKFTLVDLLRLSGRLAG